MSNKGLDPNFVVYGIIGGGILTCLIGWLDGSIGDYYHIIIIQMVLTILWMIFSGNLFDKLNKKK